MLFDSCRHHGIDLSRREERAIEEHLRFDQQSFVLGQAAPLGIVDGIRINARALSPELDQQKAPIEKTTGRKHRYRIAQFTALPRPARAQRRLETAVPWQGANRCLARSSSDRRLPVSNGAA